MLLSCEIGQPKQKTKFSQNVVKHRCDHHYVPPPLPSARLPTGELVIEDHQNRSPNTIFSLLFSKYCHPKDNNKIVKDISNVYFPLSF